MEILIFTLGLMANCFVLLVPWNIVNKTAANVFHHGMLSNLHELVLANKSLEMKFKWFGVLHKPIMAWVALSTPIIVILQYELAISWSVLLFILNLVAMIGVGIVTHYVHERLVINDAIGIFKSLDRAYNIFYLGLIVHITVICLVLIT